MEFETNDENDIKEIVKRYEALLKQGSGILMSDVELEEVVNYYYVNNKNAQALFAIENSILQFPYDSYFYYIKSLILSEQGKMKEAIKVIEIAISLEPSNPLYYEQKGEIYESFDKYSKAIEVYKEALNLKFETTKFILNISLCYKHDGNVKEAKIWLNKVNPKTELDNHSIFDTMLGYQLLEMEEECINFFTKYTDEYPYSSVGWFALAESYFSIKNYKKAVQAMEYSILINDEFFEAWNKKGIYLISDEEYIKAIECLTKSIELNNLNSDAYSNLATCYLKTGNLQEALKNFKICLKHDKEDPDAWAGIANIYMENEEYTKALHYMKKAVEIDFDSDEKQLLLAKIYFYLGQEDQSLNIYKSILFENNSTPQLWIDWSYMIWCNDDKPNAISMLKYAIINEEFNAELLYQLAAFCLLTKKIKTGKSFLEKALALNFNKKDLFFKFAPEFINSSEINELIELYNPKNHLK